MKIKQTTKNEPVNVYDITVDHPNHRFFANGKSLHNCHIVHKMIYHQVCTSQIGIPIDYDHTLKSLRTTIRRTILLERKWAVIQERHKKDYKISSNEQANIFVGDLLRENFFGASDSFDQWALETFMMKTKHVTVGKDDKARLKTTYGMDDSVMTLILKKLPKLDYSNEIKDAITDTLDILSLYRSLTHDLPSYTGLIRSAWRDDRGFVMGNGATRMEGTDTGRASAQKGTGVPRANITFGKLKTKVDMRKDANGLISSVNVQGMSSKSYSLKSANKITKMPDHIKEQIEELNREVESRLTILIRDT